MGDKFQTKTQLLLEILLGETKEDLALSEERMRILHEDGDIETWNIERKTYNGLQKKLGRINWLIGFEDGSSSNCESRVEIYTIHEGGKESLSDIIVSELI